MLNIRISKKVVWAGLMFVFVFGLQGCKFFDGVEGKETSGHRDNGMPLFNPRNYVCYKVRSPLVIDGIFNEESWLLVPWTEPFQDIRGGDFPSPQFETKVKMLWDDRYLYVAAILEEPHIQGKITQRDAVIFHDNDFEVFIDPNGDTHLYYELEINALNTIWDLLLVKPYRDGGPAVNGFDTKGIRTAVFVDGTLNNPSDIDKCWCVELAIPFDALSDISNSRKPVDGDQWRINFSRVQWHTDIVEGEYVKRTNAETGKTLPEENWVWSPQGVVNMHRPETWGFVQFSNIQAGAGTVDFEFKPVENVKWVLRSIYLAQRRYYSEFGEYTEDLSLLVNRGFVSENIPYVVDIKKIWGTYVARMKTELGTWFINNEGFIWSEESN
ncbi:carbohydrate-binding family 9-like protein [Thermophagus sp. OGC60D27]|uniref:carbohydrate-binding family 9-like protein n=1 Tax=Thermophagus sp. OGC60D27 TaxID=3458415 RepID=UPI0040376AB8